MTHAPSPTMDDLGDLLDFWRARLRLMDWDIVLETYRLKQWTAMGKSAYTVGFCAESRPNGMARIAMLDIADMPDDIAEPCRDVEQTLVHELLHLLMPVSASDGSDADGERAINRVAQALVRLRRESNVIKETP